MTQFVYNSKIVLKTYNGDICGLHLSPLSVYSYNNMEAATAKWKHHWL
jgi:hypothetical protein